MAMENFYTVLTEQINRQIEPVYGLRVTLITSASQGDFHWFYENVNNIFNRGTFDYVSARVSPDENIAGTAQMSPAGGFPNAYVQVITAIYYALSREDEKLLTDAVNAASAQASLVVNLYQQNFGKITDAQMEQGQAALGLTAVSNKQDYVIGFIMGYQWSGRQDAARPALSYSEMAAARDLARLLPLLPPLGNSVLGAAQRYLNILGPANTFEDQVFLGGWTIAQLKNNTARPDEANGGMKLVDPNTGAISNGYQVGYGVTVPIAEIQANLSDPTRVIHAEVPVAGESPLQLLLDDGSRLDFSALGSYTIVIDYPGYTLVPTGPSPWLESTNTGWFAGQPIAEANRNIGQSASGFHFTVPPAYDLGPLAAGGDFGLITDLLISASPIVTIRGGSAKAMSADARLAQGVSGRLVLAGAPGERLFSRQRYSVALPRTEGDGATLLLSPEVVKSAAAVSPLEQTAYVIGGAFDFPGVWPGV